MVYEEFALTTLYDKPVFVVWSYWACPVELGNVERTCLSARRCEDDLEYEKKRGQRPEGNKWDLNPNDA